MIAIVALVCTLGTGVVGYMLGWMNGFRDGVTHAEKHGTDPTEWPTYKR